MINKFKKSLYKHKSGISCGRFRRSCSQSRWQNVLFEICELFSLSLQSEIAERVMKSSQAWHCQFAKKNCNHRMPVIICDLFAFLTFPVCSVFWIKIEWSGPFLSSLWSCALYILTKIETLLNLSMLWYVYSFLFQDKPQIWKEMDWANAVFGIQPYNPLESFYFPDRLNLSSLVRRTHCWHRRQFYVFIPDELSKKTSSITSITFRRNRRLTYADENTIELNTKSIQVRLWEGVVWTSEFSVENLGLIVEQTDASCLAEEADMMGVVTYKNIWARSSRLQMTMIQEHFH